MDKSSWAFICHADFPRAILTQSQCISVIATLDRMDSGKQQIQAAIKIGWVRIRCASADTLGWLRGAVARLERNLTCRLIVLSQSPPDFYAIFLDIPTSIMETNEEMLRIIQKESPNREFWKIVCATQGSDVLELGISIPKNSVADLKKANFKIEFKGQPFTLRLELYEKNEKEYDILGPKMYPTLGSDSCSPGFEKKTLGGPSKETVSSAVQETQEDVLRRRLYNYLRKLKIDSKEANERAKNALSKYRKFKLETKKICSIGKFAYDFFNVEVLYNRLECLQIIDEMAEPPDYSNNTFFILCHKEYPRVFFEPAVLRTIKAKLLDFKRIIPLKVAISQVAVAEGCLKVECGNEGTFKLVARIVECNEFWKILKHDKIPEFRCIQLSIPHKIRQNSDDEILATIKEENASLDCTSWCSAGQNPEAGDLCIVMDVTSFEALEINSFLINYLGNVYHAQPRFDWTEDTIFSNPTQEKEKLEASSPKNEIENSGNVGEMQEEMQKLTGILIEAGIASVEANKRSRAAICMYQQFKLLLSTKLQHTSSSKGFTFCNGDIFNDHFVNIQLFDEMLTQPVEFSGEKFFILSHSNFPKTFFNQFNLEHISNKLLEFVNKMSIKPALGDICIDEGWLTVQYGNEGTLKWLKRVIHFTTSESFPSKVVLKDETPELYFIHLKVPIKSESSSSALPTLKSENNELDTSSWEIARRVSCDLHLEIITIFMNGVNIDALRNNSWRVWYFDIVYVVEAYCYNVEKGMTRLTEFLDPESNALDEMLEETTKLYEHIKVLGVSSSEAKERTYKALTIYKQFKVLVKTKPKKKSLTFFNKEILEDHMENLFLLDELLTQPIKANGKHFILCHNTFPKRFFGGYTLSTIKKTLRTFIRQSPVGLTIGRIVLQEGWLSFDGANEATVKWLKRVLKFTEGSDLPLKLLAADEVSDFVFITFKIPTNKKNYVANLDNLKKENLSANSWEIAKQFFILVRGCRCKVITIYMNEADFEELKMKSFTVQYYNNSYKAWPYLYNSEKGIVKLDHISQIIDDIFTTERRQLYEHLNKAGICDSECHQRIQTVIDKYKQLRSWFVPEKSLTEKFTFFHQQIVENSLENLLLLDEILLAPVSSKLKGFILCHKNFPKTFFNSADVLDIKNKLNEFLVSLPLPLTIGRISVDEGWLKVDDASEPTIKWLRNVVKFTKTSLYPLALLIIDDISDVFFITVEIPRKTEVNAIILKNLKNENSGLDTASWEIVRRVSLNTSSEIMTITMDSSNFEALKLRSFSVLFNNRLAKVKAYQYSSGKVVLLDGFHGDMDKLKTQLYEHLTNSGMNNVVGQRRTEVVIQKYSEFKLLVKKYSQGHGLTFFIRDIIKDDYQNITLFNNMLTEPVKFTDDKYFILCHLNFPNVFLNQHNLLRIQSKLNEFLNESPVRPAIGEIVVDEGWLIVHFGNEAALQWLKRVVKFTLTGALPLKLLTTDETPEFGFVYLKLPFKTLEMLGMDNLLNSLIRNNKKLVSGSWHIARCAIKDGRDEVTLVMDMASFNALKNWSFKLWFQGNIYQCEPYEFSHKNFQTASLEGLQKTGGGLREKVSESNIPENSQLIRNQKEFSNILPTNPPDSSYKFPSLNNAISTSNMPVIFSPKNEVKKRLTQSFCEMGVDFIAAEQRANMAIAFNDKVASVNGSFSDEDAWENVQMFDAMLTQPVKMSDEHFCIICHSTFPQVFFSTTILDAIINALNSYVGGLPVKPAIEKLNDDEGWLKIHYGNDATLRWLKRIISFKEFVSLDATLLTRDQIPRFWAVFFNLPFTCCQLDSIPAILQKLKSENGRFDCRSWSIVSRKRNNNLEEFHVVMNEASFGELQEALFNIQYSANMYIAMPSSLHNYFCFNDSPTEKISGTSKGIELNEEDEKIIKEKEIELEPKLQKLKQLQLEFQKLQQEFSAVLKEKEELSSQKPNEVLTTADHSQESKSKLDKKPKKKNAKKKKKKKSKQKKGTKSSSCSGRDGESRRISRSQSRERNVSELMKRQSSNERRKSYTRSRSRSKHIPVRRTQRSRSRSKEIPVRRTQRSRSRSKEIPVRRIKRSRSRSKDIPVRRIQRSRSRSKDIPVRRIQRSRSRSKDIPVRRIQRSRSRSKEIPVRRIQRSRSRSKEIPVRRIQRSRSRSGDRPARRLKRSRSKGRLEPRTRKSRSRSRNITVRSTQRSRSRSRNITVRSSQRSRSRSRNITVRSSQRSRSRSRNITVRRTQRSRSRSRNIPVRRTWRSRSNSRRRSYGSKPSYSKTTLKYDSDKNRKTRYSPSRRRQYRSRSRKRDRTPSVETSQRKTKPRSRSNSTKRKRYGRSSSSSSSSEEESKTKRRRSKSSESDFSKKQCITKSAEEMPDKSADDEGGSIVESKSKDEKSVVESREAATESTSKIAEAEATAPLAEDMPVALSEREKRLNCSRLMELQGVGNILPVRDEDSFSNPPTALDNAGEERLHNEFNNFLDELKDLCNFFKGENTQKPENQEE